MPREVDPDLLVFEYSGTARSGKGTIVSYLATQHEGLVTDETGADYRAVTKALLAAEQIDPDMSTETIQQVVGNIGLGHLTEIAADRLTVIGEHGRESLYNADVNEMVARIAPVQALRKAIKAGFMKR